MTSCLAQEFTLVFLLNKSVLQFLAVSLFILHFLFGQDSMAELFNHGSSFLVICGILKICGACFKSLVLNDKTSSDDQNSRTVSFIFSELLIF